MLHLNQFNSFFLTIFDYESKNNIAILATKIYSCEFYSELIFINKNLTICQEDCNLVEYNYTLTKGICSCKVKQSSSSFADIKINKEQLLNSLNSFKEIKNMINFNILFCYRNLLDEINIIYNLGFYSLLLIIIL